MKAIFRALWSGVFFILLIIGAYGLGGGYAVTLAIGFLGMCAVLASSVAESLSSPATPHGGPKERSEPRINA